MMFTFCSHTLLRHYFTSCRFLCQCYDLLRPPHTTRDTDTIHPCP